jgi:glycerol-3-phosphate dehydrogenase (NAD(P)+)
MKIKNITVIGDGGWGTTLAIHLLKKAYDVTLWGPFPQYVAEMKDKRQNAKFLPNINLPRELKLTSDLKEALGVSQLIVFVIPSQYARETLKKMKPYVKRGHIFLSATKGIDTTNLLRISQMAEDEFGRVPLAVLSGPTIAKEVALGIPSTAVVASKNKKLAVDLQNVFNSDTFRIYTNDDVIGVELGGSVKNIIAIACGVCDGLGFGTNTKAALLNRGLVEMARLGKVLGAKEKTFYGLSGLGDLATTCFSPQSRNRTVGEALGRGKSIQEILSSMDMVAEGVETAKAVYKLAQKRKIAMPITTEVYNIVCKNKKASVAVADLMTRKTKAE